MRANQGQIFTVEMDSRANHGEQRVAELHQVFDAIAQRVSNPVVTSSRRKRRSSSEMASVLSNINNRSPKPSLRPQGVPAGEAGIRRMNVRSVSAGHQQDRGADRDQRDRRRSASIVSCQRSETGISE